MKIKGEIRISGDKSISHRALMLASLSDGESIINNISTGEDVETTRKCLEACGLESKENNNTLVISGKHLKSPKTTLDCRNSGTSIRLLSGLLSGQGISANFIGDRSLEKRPMNRIIKPLKKMGAKIQSNNGYLPLEINVTDLKGITYISEVASAQVKSAVLLAGLGAKGVTRYLEEMQTRDHTEIMLLELGAQIDTRKYISIQNMTKPLSAFTIHIPGDPSSAAFFCGLVAMLPSSQITVKNILANPLRVGFYDILIRMGADVEWNNLHKECGEWVGDVNIFGKPLMGIDITKDMIPSIIDELPIISVISSFADGPTTVSGAGELRVKETDRIRAICCNLSRMGCDIIEKKDGFIINPGNKLYGTNIKTFDDHRIAMAFTIAGLMTEDKNILDNSNCIDISFPEFNKILSMLIQ